MRAAARGGLFGARARTGARRGSRGQSPKQPGRVGRGGSGTRGAGSWARGLAFSACACGVLGPSL